MEDFEQDMFGLDDIDNEGQAVEAPDEGAPVDDSDTVYEDSDYSEEPEADYVTTLLKNKGIDRNKIQVYDEDNNLVEMNFDDLNDQQKVAVLSDDQGAPIDSVLSDAEIDTLNFLRSNNMTLQDFAEWQKKQAVDEYLAQQQPESEIDTYTDDEIIAYDLIKRFGDEMSDEEIDAEVDRLKGDPDAYAKRVALLRNSYRSEAEAQAKLYEDQQVQQRDAFNSSFMNAYQSAAADLNDIQGFSLDNADKSELLDFVLTKDAAGKTAFFKALDNPTNVLKMAWGLLHGDEAHEKTVDYFKSEIARREKNGPRAVSRQKPANGRKDAFKFN